MYVSEHQNYHLELTSLLQERDVRQIERCFLREMPLVQERGELFLPHKQEASLNLPYVSHERCKANWEMPLAGETWVKDQFNLPYISHVSPAPAGETWVQDDNSERCLLQERRELKINLPTWDFSERCLCRTWDFSERCLLQERRELFLPHKQEASLNLPYVSHERCKANWEMPLAGETWVKENVYILTPYTPHMYIFSHPTHIICIYSHTLHTSYVYILTPSCRRDVSSRSICLTAPAGLQANWQFQFALRQIDSQWET